MKKILIFFVFAFSLLSPSFVSADTWVNGYYKSNGTYVNGHYRSSPDGNPYNNYSFPGNTNPYTGKVAPGNSDTYLNNYYNSKSYTPTYKSIYNTPSYYDSSLYTGASGLYYDFNDPAVKKAEAKKDKVCNNDSKNYNLSKCADETLNYQSAWMKTGTSFYDHLEKEKKEEEKKTKDKEKRLSKKQTSCEKKGSVWYDNSCLKPLEVCRYAFGSHSTYVSGTKADDLSCSCENGYNFSNFGEKSCVKQ